MPSNLLGGLAGLILDGVIGMAQLIGTRLVRNLILLHHGEAKYMMTMNALSWRMFLFVLMVSACTPVLTFRLRNESGQNLEMYARGERRLIIHIGEISKNSIFFGGNWSLKAGECEYRYFFPEVSQLTRTSEGRTSVFTVVVDTDFVASLEYPPGWKGHKAPIEGLPAVPEKVCASLTAP